MKIATGDKCLIVLLCFYMAVLPSCSSDGPTDPGDVAPEIPPLTTMSMDFSLFPEDGGKASLGDAALQFTQANFLRAVLTVTIFNVAVLAATAIPVAATAAALSANPTLEDDGKFHWEFTTTTNNQTLTLELVGEVRPSVVHWEMFVSRQLPTPLDKFRWYEGDSAIDGGSGFWQFYNDSHPNEQRNHGRIDWEYISDDDRTLMFTNNNPDDQGVGSTLTYEVMSPDISVEFLNAGAQDTVKAAWNNQTGEGYIIDPNFNNGEKSCWDENQQDVQCTN